MNGTNDLLKHSQVHNVVLLMLKPSDGWDRVPSKGMGRYPSPTKKPISMDLGS